MGRGKVKPASPDNTKMKALYFDKKLEFRNNYPIPVPAENEALIKITLAGICNTDKEIMKGYVPFTGVLGHEFVGVVTECSQLEFIGKRVVGEINIGCGVCSLCKNGMRNHCPQRNALGIHGKDGVFAEYVTIPIENLFIVPDEISDEEAVFAEPLAAAFNILQNVEISKQDKVVIIGDGKLGQLIARAVSTTSCDLTMIGKHASKLELAQDFCKTMILKKSFDLESSFDVVIECTGNESALHYAALIVCAKGTIVLKSTYADDIKINPSLWVRKEIRLIGSRCGPFAPALQLMQRNKIDLTKLIDKIFFIDKWENAFEVAFLKGTLKVLLKL